MEPVPLATGARVSGGRAGATTASGRLARAPAGLLCVLLAVVMVGCTPGASGEGAGGAAAVLVAGDAGVSVERH